VNEKRESINKNEYEWQQMNSGLKKIKVLQRGGHEDGSGKRAVNLTRKGILFILCF
jgi:hypothetical protein